MTAFNWIIWLEQEKKSSDSPERGCGFYWGCRGSHGKPLPLGKGEEVLSVGQLLSGNSSFQVIHQTILSAFLHHPLLSHGKIMKRKLAVPLPVALE